MYLVGLRGKVEWLGGYKLKTLKLFWRATSSVSFNTPQYTLSSSYPCVSDDLALALMTQRTPGISYLTESNSALLEENFCPKIVTLAFSYAKDIMISV